MRLIDADYAEKMLRSLGNRAFRRENGTIMDAIKMISNQSCTPTVDAVEVVRCKDCVHWGNTFDDESYCTNHDGLDNFARPDDFCSYGERRSDNAAD